MRAKEESEKAGLKVNIKKTKITASGPITSWQIKGEKVEPVTISLLGFWNNCGWWLQGKNGDTDIENRFVGHNGGRWGRHRLKGKHWNTNTTICRIDSGNLLYDTEWKIPWTENPGAGYSPWGGKESDTTEQLHFHFSLSQGAETRCSVKT